MATRLFNLTWLKTQTGRDLDEAVDSSTLALGEKADGTQGAFTFFQGIKNFFKGVTALGSLTSSGKIPVLNTSTGAVNYVTVESLSNVVSGLITTNTVEAGNSAPVSSKAVAGHVVNSVTSGNMNPVTSNAVATVTSSLTPKNQIEMYTLGEFIIGKFIDNQNLYRRVIKLNTAMNAVGNEWVETNITLGGRAVSAWLLQNGINLYPIIVSGSTRLIFMHTRNTTIDLNTNSLVIIDYYKTVS